MWISTRAQYGLRALIDIGRHQGAPVPLREVSKRQCISLHYLEQIVGQLRRAGYIRSVRGAKGGYQLARPPGQLNCYDIVTVLEGSLAPVACLEEGQHCDSQVTCATHDLWRRVDDAIREVLGSTTLESLIWEAEQQEHAQLLQLT